MSKDCGTYIPSQLLALIRSSPLLLTGKEESKKLLADEVTYVATPFLSLGLLLLGLLAFHHFHEIVITTFELLSCVHPSKSSIVPSSLLIYSEVIPPG